MKKAILAVIVTVWTILPTFAAAQGQVCGEFFGFAGYLQLEGAGAYRVGDTVHVTLKQDVNASYFDQVDLWVAIELPQGMTLFMGDNLFNRFTTEPTPYLRSFQRNGMSVDVLSFPVPPDMGGDYIFHAFYTREGATLDDLYKNLRSNVAVAVVTLSNR